MDLGAEPAQCCWGFSRPDFLAEKPIQQILMNGKILQPENWIAVRLKVPFDFVPDSRVHVIGTPSTRTQGFPSRAHQVRIFWIRRRIF